MKPHNLFIGALGYSKTLRLFRVAIATPALMATITLSRAEDTKDPKDPEKPAEKQASADAIVESTGESELANWISFGMGGAFVRGDETAMMRRTRTNGGDLWGGIDSLHLEEQVSDTATLTFNGHALTGLEDYDFSIDLQDSNWGFVKAGYKQFRTWYDATGGYLAGVNPAVNRVYGLFDDDRAIDRGEAYFTAGLRKENLPEITFSYRHLWRDGEKDSTSWGDSQSVNLGWPIPPTGSNPTSFKLLPALWSINETTDIFDLDIEHTMGKTEVGMGFAYENYDLDNSRYTPRWRLTGVTNNITNTTLTDKTHAETFAGNVHSVTRFNDKAWLSYAASYSTMDSNIDGGTRLWSYTFGAPGQRDYAYDQMRGGANVKQFVTNVNLMAVPVTDLTITPSFRYENENTDVLDSFRAFNATTGWGGMQSLVSFTDKDSYIGALDIRYTGLDDIVLYGKAQIGREDEDIFWQDRYLPGESLATAAAIDENEYMVGANWYALSNLSFSIQGLHSTRNQALSHSDGNQSKVGPLSNPGGSNSLRPIMSEHDTSTDDLNFRVTYRPASNLSLVTRYDYAQTDFDNGGLGVNSLVIGSGNIFSHIISQSATWNPLESLYLQGTASWINSETDTPLHMVGVSHNDYVAATLSVGYAIDKLTDLSASYTFYGAGNYINSETYGGVDTMGYGLNTKEHAINVTLTRMLAPNKIWNLRYGFMSSNTDPGTDQFGGYNDFDAHMISTGLQIRF